jgi:S-adenosylmethionine:tRNA-ribosyltransferase-isomerase (queuine synthetase)
MTTHNYSIQNIQPNPENGELEVLIQEESDKGNMEFMVCFHPASQDLKISKMVQNKKRPVNVSMAMQSEIIQAIHDTLQEKCGMSISAYMDQARKQQERKAVYSQIH